MLGVRYILLLILSCSLLIALAIGLMDSKPKEAPRQPLCEFVSEIPKVQVETFSYSSCILARFGVYLKLADNKYLKFENGVIGKETRCRINAGLGPILKINYDCGSLELRFSTNARQTTFLSYIELRFDGKRGFRAIPNLYRFLSTDNEHFYQCDPEQRIETGREGTLIFSNVSIDVVRKTTSQEFFKEPNICTVDE